MMVITEAAGTDNPLGWVLGGTTLLFVAIFCGWSAWVLAPRRRTDMENAARLPLDDLPTNDRERA